MAVCRQVAHVPTWEEELSVPGDPPNAKVAPPELSSRLRIAGIVLRSLFIAILVALTWRMSRPQSETIWTVYETPGDLIRLALGVGACLWMAIQLFILPKDGEAYRTWVYLGIVLVPLGLIFTALVW
jgi:hypothetical protein